MNRQTKVGGKTEMDSFGAVWGETPLHIAAVAADEPVIKILLDAGADKTIQTSQGKTAYSFANEYERSESVLTLLR